MLREGLVFACVLCCIYAVFFMLILMWSVSKASLSLVGNMLLHSLKPGLACSNLISCVQATRKVLCYYQTEIVLV